MTKKYVLFLMLCALYAGAMDVVPQAVEQKKTFKFATANSDGKIMEVPYDILRLSSALVGMISDLDGDNSNVIPLDNISYKTLFRLVKMLEFYQKPAASLDQRKARVYRIAKAYSAPELVEIINAANYLGIDENVLKIFADAAINLVKEHNSEYEKIALLSPDFAEKYIIPYFKEEIIAYMKSKILRQNGKNPDRKKCFNHPIDFAAYPLIAGEFFNGNDIVILENPSATLGLYKVVNDEKILDLFGDDNDLGVYAIAIYKNKLIAAGLTNDTVLIWNLEKKENVGGIEKIKFCKLVAPIIGVKKLLFSSDGRFLGGTGDSNNTKNGYQDRLYIWDVQAIDWSKDTSLSGYQFSYDADYSTQGLFFVPRTHEFLMVLFEPLSKVMKILNIDIFDGGGFNIKSESIIAHADIGNFNFIKEQGEQVVFNSDGSKMAFVLQDNIIVWDVTNNFMIKEWKVSSSLRKIFSIQFSSDDRLIAVAGLEKIVIYDALSGALLIELNGLHRNIAVRFSPNGKKMLSVGGYGSQEDNQNRTCLWDLVTEEESEELEALTKLRIDIVLLIQLYKATLSNIPVKISEDLELFKNVKGLLKKFDLIEEEGYEPIIEDDSFHNKANESEFIKSPEEVLASKEVPAQGRLQQWWQWFENRPWKKIFGIAVAGAAGYGLYKYVTQEK